jgi:methylenetetrahydrofolate dehydrogenase (NADP+) / methenyltetrahydrofolate cyclohydrolase
MPAQIISGKAISTEIKEELRQEIQKLKSVYNIIPGLATILVGSDAASKVYVGAKEKACRDLGIYSERLDLPGDTTEAYLIKLIDQLNNKPEINGILVQVPLPRHIDENKVLFSISPDKDVDGFHPVNLGKLMIGKPDYIPCTPHGIQQLLIRSGVKTEGAETVIIGRSNIVGKPIANLMLQKTAGANSTVTVCHTATRDLKSHTLRADILIAAAGKPKSITADMIKEGAVVIDVGTNEIGKTFEGKRILCGDVDFDNVKHKASMITPVPGGVGPMTITMLMLNTVKAAKISAGISR